MRKRSISQRRIDLDHVVQRHLPYTYQRDVLPSTIRHIAQHADHLLAAAVRYTADLTGQAVCIHAGQNDAFPPAGQHGYRSHETFMGVANQDDGVSQGFRVGIGKLHGALCGGCGLLQPLKYLSVPHRMGTSGFPHHGYNTHSHSVPPFGCVHMHLRNTEKYYTLVPKKKQYQNP